MKKPNQSRNEDGAIKVRVLLRSSEEIFNITENLLCV